MNVRNTLAVMLLLMLLQGSFLGASQNSSRSLPDSIDIFIIDEANHIWDTFGYTVWQYFVPDNIPILLFQSPDQHWMINHLNLPDDFINSNFLDHSLSVKTPDSEPWWNYFSATIWIFYGNWTAILPSYSAWKSFSEQRNLPGSIFTPDQLVFISLHERFHAFQMRWLQDDFKTLFKIPTFNSPPESREEILSDIDENSEQASLCSQEQNSLYQAYIEKDVVKSKRAISEFLRYRNQRMLLMNEKEIETENYMELIEGTAQYIEFRLAESFRNGFQALHAIDNHPEFQNYKNAMVSPSLSIQNAETGVLISSRVYTTGTIICLLLDRYSKNEWQMNIFKNFHDSKTNLCNLLEKCI